MNEFDQNKIRKMDGALLLIFRELLARRRASEVAKHLGLSPSAVSHALDRLRDLFGDTLFLRRSRGLEPTQKAIELAPRVNALLDLMGATISADREFDAASSKRRFRIACPDAIASLIGNGLVNAFRGQAPLAHFSTRYAILDHALRALRRGEVDLALGVFDQVPSGFIAQPLYEDEYCVIARNGHPLVDGAVDLVTYARAGHLFVGNPDGALADEPPIDREIMDATYGQLPGPEAICTHGYVTQWETAMLIVSQTDALADCPRRLAQRYAKRLGLQVLEPPFQPFRFLVQAVRRGDGVDRGLDWFLARVIEASAA